MTVICDSSGILAAYDEASQYRSALESIFYNPTEELVISPLILAEVDYLVQRRYGDKAELALLEDLSLGPYTIAVFDNQDFMRAREVLVQYRALGMGLADASNVALAARYRTNRILTLDQRHFRAIRPLTGEDAFEIYPDDL